MARKKRKSASGRKRTITPEHLAKMQEGRRKAKLHKERIQMAQERGLIMEDTVTDTQRRLNSVRRG